MAIRMIDPWVNVTMGAGPPPEWLIRVKEDTFRAGDEFTQDISEEKLLADMDEKVYEQVTNVATLPGIVQASYAMPDAHWGYGFPIGGVAAFDADEGGVVSGGGVGFDISCGVRSFVTGLGRRDIGGISLPLSVYVHLPFCDRICYYCACTKVVTRDHGRSAKYTAYLAREIRYARECLGEPSGQGSGARPISQLHWGGGTPTFLAREEMAALMRAPPGCTQ